MNGIVLALESDSDDSISSDILGLSDGDAEMQETNNDNVSDNVEALISDDSDDEEKEQYIKQWLTEIDSMHKTCLGDQKNANEKMIGRHLSQFPPTEYVVNKEILVRNPAKTGQSTKKRLDQPVSLVGTILKKKDYHYKVRYVDENGETKSDWFSVKNITSRTKESENAKHEISRISKDMTKNHEMPTLNPLITKMSSSQTETNPHRRWNNMLWRRMQDYDLQPLSIDADGNCFFHAVSHQIYGTTKYHEKVRRQAVEHIRDNIGDYMKFIEGDEDIIEYLDRMQRPGEWATNAAIQATADALQVDILIIPSHENHVESPIVPITGYSTQTLFLGHISDTHYVSSTSFTTFTPLRYGSESQKQTKRLINTCPIDGPLTLIFNMIQRYSHLQSIIKDTTE